MKHIIRKFALLAITLFVTVISFAQVTTSSISGQIRLDGEAISGATVIATHTPSGSKYVAVTNQDGRYTLQGLRTGGPYTISVSFLGYSDAEFKGITLSLGNTYVQDANLKEDSQMLSTLIVTASAEDAKEGASKNFNQRSIESTPTVKRDIYDIVKNMPMVGNSKTGGISFAGMNNRYNSFQIDGTVSNDVFGLSSGGTNGDQSGAKAISLEAVQEIQVVIAPFDVRQSGFTGGGINAITKQGDNTFKATAYSYFNNQSLYGQYNARTEKENKLSTQSTLTYGGSVGGAIVKNKLFYYVNVEQNTETYPSSIYPGFDDSYISKEIANQVMDKYKEYTGFQESFGPRDINRKGLSSLARIDWNISNKHKLAVRYQGNISSRDNYSSNNYTMSFNNSGYTMTNNTNSFVAELTSAINDKWHNEFRVSASFVRDNRDVAYKGPNVSITGDASTNDIDMRIGTEYSSGANYLNQDVYTIEDNVSWYLGNHNITFGTHNEFYRITNQFIQASYGAWSFDSVDDFMNDKPAKFEYKYTDPEAETTGGNSLWAPTMNFAQFGIYAQDKWTPTNNFTLTYGIRLDMPTALSTPTTNAEFNKFAADNGMDARVGTVPSPKLMVSPRIGFQWYLDESKNTLIRGGVGLFTGRVPFVWLSNAYTNTGIEQKGTTIYGDDAPSLAAFAKNPLSAATQGSSGRPDIVTVDKSFKFPQVFRVNLAVEQFLPGDIKATLEGVYSKTLNNVLFENLALTKDGTIEAIQGVPASSVPFYTNKTGAYNTIVNLTNTDKGYSYALSALLTKNFSFGLNLTASYTHGRSMSVNDGTSSVSYSNWKYNYSMDPNSGNELGFSRFDIPHKVMFQVAYSTPKYLNGLMQTNVALIYNGYSGSRYSLVVGDASYKSDFNGDGWGGNSLLFIPTEAELEKMVFTDIVDKKTGDVIKNVATQRAEFGEWIKNDKYASQHRGQYAERNSNQTPWENRIDLHIAQSIFYLKERGSKVEITFDIMNLTNLLNKNWGASWSAPYNIEPIDQSRTTKDGVHTITYQTNSASDIEKSDISSRWHAQVGLRLTF